MGQALLAREWEIGRRVFQARECRSGGGGKKKREGRENASTSGPEKKERYS